MFLYQIVNTVSGTKYYGITKNPKARMASHKYKHKSTKTPLYCAMKAYGFDKFTMEILETGPEEYIAQREIELVASDTSCYNLHQGGHIGFDVTTKDSKSVEEWKSKLRDKRKGRTPSLGMTHSDTTKKLCGEYAKLRWDIYGRYPKEVLDYSFSEANKKYGISKTHYYRLRKAAGK